MNEIYLSPRKILSYLKDLESKIPLIHSRSYPVDSDNQFATDGDICREAKKMLEYVGLFECIPTCKFEETKDSCAGYTVNNYSVKEIFIGVNRKYRNIPIACRAILAHEICHKVIFLNGINYLPPLQDYNEIFTDLCTIYIGFGEVILKGYINKQNTLNMGYLKPDMYRQTFNIIAKTTDKYPLSGELNNLNDPYLEDALSIWHSPEDAKKTLHEGFHSNQKKISEFNRNILLLHQILDQVYSAHGVTVRKQSKEAEKLGIFDKELSNKPITLFSIIYETLFANENKEPEVYTAAETEVNNLILALADEYHEINLGALSYDTLKCPNCGHASKTTIEDRDSIIRCSSCKTYFRFCNSHLNITKMRRLRDEKLERERKETEKREAEIKWIEKEKSLIAEEKISLRSQLNSSYERGRSAGRNEKSEDVRQKIEALPGWLKFLIGKRLSI